MRKVVWHYAAGLLDKPEVNVMHVISVGRSHSHSHIWGRGKLEVIQIDGDGVFFV